MKKRGLRLLLLIWAAAVLTLSASADWKDDYDGTSQIGETEYYFIEQNDVKDEEGKTYTGIGVADRKGKVIHEPVYRSIDEKLTENLRIFTDANHKSGFMDDEFRIVIKAEYDYINNFKNSRAEVGIARLDGTYRIFFIDKEGNKTDDGSGVQDLSFQIRKLEMETGLNVNDTRGSKFAIVQQDLGGADNYKFGLASMQSYMLLTDIEWDTMLFAQDGQVWCGKKTGDNKYEYYTLGKSYTPEYRFTAAKVVYIDADGYAYFEETREVRYEDAKTEYKFIGVCDNSGKIVVPAELEVIYRTFENGYIVTQKGSTQFYNERGVGLVGNGKYGCVRPNGEVLLDFIYDMLIDKGNGVVEGYTGGEEFVFNLEENSSREPDYSDWAKESIERALAGELVPGNLRTEYQSRITRQEFAHLAVQTYAVATGLQINEVLELEGSRTGSFQDTSDEKVLAAYRLGIVNGKGEGNFEPASSITRQEAAVMLHNLADALGLEIQAGGGTAYADAGTIASWALESVQAVSALKSSAGTAIMGGTGENRFSPLDSYTRQESIVTMLRLFDIYKEQ